MAARLKCLCLAALLFVANGCGTCRNGVSRPFEPTDRLAFRNELRWTYRFDDGGRRVSTERTTPPPAYDLHCFPMARATREFFYHARFDPGSAAVSVAEYRELVRAVIGRDSRCPSSPDDKIVIPGFANLASFSQMHEHLLKELCGSAISSYTQRGNWRMIFPFSRAHQARTAGSLADRLERGLLPIVHISDFPTLTVNHALLATAVSRRESGMTFELYDPNAPERTAELTFDFGERRFRFERNNYFGGGVVDVYEVYKNALF